MPRISQLPSLTTADNADEIAIVDVSASTTKKITRGDLLKSPLPTNSVTTAAVADNAITASKIDFTTLNFGNYPTTETDTGFKNNLSATIYVRTFTGSITQSTNVRNTTTLMTLTSAARILKCDGWFFVGGFDTYMPVGTYDPAGRSSTVDNAGGTIRFVSQSEQARTSAPYMVRVFYTKS